MALFAIQNASEIASGQPIKSAHLINNFNAIISDFSDRLSLVTSNPQAIAGQLTTNGAFIGAGANTLSGATTISGSLTASNTALFSGALTANSTADFNDAVTLDDSTTFASKYRYTDAGVYQWYDGSSWLPVAPGKGVLFNTTTISSSAAVEITWEAADYQAVFFEFDSIDPASDNAIFKARFGVSDGGGGTTYKSGASDYRYSNFSGQSAGINYRASNNDNELLLTDSVTNLWDTVATTSEIALSGCLTMMDTNAAQKHWANSWINYHEASSSYGLQSVNSGYGRFTDAIKGFQFFATNSGGTTINLATGKIRAYGVPA
jgi:hypothetical protein